MKLLDSRADLSVNSDEEDDNHTASSKKESKEGSAKGIKKVNKERMSQDSDD